MIESIEIKFLRYPKLAKCSSCARVRDIYYKAFIYDVDDNTKLVGDLELCKLCGENLHRAAGSNENNSLKAGERVLKTFNFGKEQS